MGHVIRAREDDPLREVTLYQGSANPLEYDKRRVGKPREQWAKNAMEEVWKKWRKDAPKVNASKPNKRRKYKASNRQNKHILNWAIGRRF